MLCYRNYYLILLLLVRFDDFIGLDSCTTEFKLLVENRVIVTRNLIPIDRWHYVST